MSDLFLHTSFARRLRLAEGTHPLVAEALVRRQPLVALGAALPLLPAVERQGMSWWRRLMSGKSDAARWQKALEAQDQPRADVVAALLVHQSSLGAMARLALGLGFLSHEILEARLRPLWSGLSSGERPGVIRAQTRLWLQTVIPNTRDVVAEWRPLAELADPDLHRRTWEHLDGALGQGLQTRGPGRDVLGRWTRGYAAQLQPLLHGDPLPPSLGTADHVARGPHYEERGFVEQVQSAVSWFVAVANRLGEAAQADDFSGEAVRDALGHGHLPDADASAEERRAQGVAWRQQRRSRDFERGRNEKPAFFEGQEARPVHRSAAFTGMMNLADLPPAALPPEFTPSLPPVSAADAPPLPAMTQEVSLADVQAAAAEAGHLPPGMPPPPAMTQEVSLTQIEAVAASQGFTVPARTQEVHAGQVIEHSAPPAMTQEVSLAQIEEARAALSVPGAAAVETEASAPVTPNEGDAGSTAENGAHKPAPLASDDAAGAATDAPAGAAAHPPVAAEDSPAARAAAEVAAEEPPRE